MKLVTWDDARASAEIKKRFANAQDSRSPFEDKWMRNERVVYSTSGAGSMNTAGDLGGILDLSDPGVDNSSADVTIAYAFKNFRFVHAQMSANPPSVVMRPNSSDQDDRRKADAADRVVRWAIRQYSMQELIDQLSLHTLLYGTGFVKTTWDATLGSILSFDEATGELKMEGDISIETPFVWNIFLDPDARAWKDVKYVIERIYMDYDEACMRWPDKKDELKQALVERASTRGSRQSELTDKKYNCVELLQYWEKGLPSNGMMGRYCMTTADGSILDSCRPSPFRFRAAGAAAAIEADEELRDETKQLLIDRLPQMAFLPYHCLTDIDVPNSPWGRSNVEYAANLQENINRLDTAQLDGIYAHGANRIVVPESADVNDQLTNSNWDVVKISGNQPPYFMEPAKPMPDMEKARSNYMSGIDHVFGVNESMFGQQSRETSATGMQYSTNQGNMSRRRLFNKYVGVVESIYKSLLKLISSKWSIQRTIHVLGKENALQAVDIKGMDLDGGYDVVGEYGVSLSLDPMTRREEIMMLQPLFKEAGIPTRTTLRMLKLNELEGMFDRIALAENRQKEIFDEMAATGRYLEPERFMDHENMIAYALDWFMTAEFKYLDPEVQFLCKEHNQARIQLAAAEKQALAGAPTGPGMPPGPLPQQAAGPLPEPSGPAPQPLVGGAGMPGGAAPQ